MKAIGIYLCLCVVPLFAVDGTVVNRTTGKPQSGATVTLYKLGQKGPEFLQSVKSGAQGKFRIDQPVPGPHLLQAAYDGVVYNHILTPGSATSNLTLDVYNSSNKPGAARLERHFLIFQPSGSQMAVNEGFVFKNDSLITYNDPDGGTLKFYLPPGAEGKVEVKAKAPNGMPIDQAAEKSAQKNVYKVAFPIKPGETNFTVMYAMPYTSPAIYQGKLLYKTDEPTLMGAPPGVTLKGEGLEAKGEEPNTHTTIYGVKAADFKVEIAGAMSASDTDSGGGGPSIEEVMPKIWGNMKWILVLALAILTLGFIVLYRAQPASAAPQPAKGRHDRGRR
jgi:Carboxypeptidase regulatory-like domain